MAFGGEMDHLVGSEGLERLGHGAPVANVDLGEAVVGRIVDRRQGLQVSGVGERVDIEHRGALGDQTPAHGRADESGAAGHKHFSLHEVSGFNVERLPPSLTAGRRGDQATRRAQHAASDCRQSGSLKPYTRLSFSLSRRELAGRRAGVG